MNRLKSVKLQWAVSYIALMLIPVIIFLSIFIVVEENVKQDVFYVDELLLNSMKKELDSYFNSLEMTYCKLEYDPNLRKLMSGPGRNRGDQLNLAADILSRTKESIIFEEIQKKIYVALPGAGLAFCSDSGVSGVETMTGITFDNITYSELESMVGDSCGNFFALNVKENNVPKRVLAYVGKLPMNSAKPEGIAVVWISDEHIVGKNGVLSTIQSREAQLVNGKGEVMFSAAEPFEFDAAKTNQARYEEGSSFISFINIEGTDWHGVVRASKSTVMGRLRTVRRLTLWGLLFCLICGAFGVLYVLRRNYSPIQNLAEMLKKKGGGKEEADTTNIFDILGEDISKMSERARKMEKSVDNQKQTLRNIYLSRLLYGQYSPELLETTEEPLSFLSDNFAVVVLESENSEKLFPDEEMSDERRTEMVQLIVTNIIEELIREQYSGYVIPYKKDFAVIVSPPAEVGFDEMRLSEIIEKGLKLIQLHFGVILRGSVSNMHRGYYGIYTGCRQAETVLEYTEFEGVVGVMTFSEFSANSNGGHPQNDQQQFEDAVLRGDFKQASESFERIIGQASAEHEFATEEQKGVLLELVDKIFDTMEEKSEAEEYIKDETEWESLREYMLGVIEKTCSEHLENRTLSSSLVEKVCNYLDEHYGDNNMSIKLLGDYFGMSPYYLSKVFKEEQGVGVGDYLRRLRINRVKKMLEQNSSVLLKDVAVKVGFTDARALKRAFLQEEGLLPSEYLTKLKSRD